jgi:hypothetical protein
MQYRVKISDDSRTVSVFTAEKVVPKIVRDELTEIHGVNMNDYKIYTGPRETGDRNLKWVTVFIKK